MPSHKLIISTVQEELLLWHSKFGHFYIRNTQKLMQSHRAELEPIIVPKTPSAARCRIPLCGSCLKCKGRRTPLRSVKHTPTAEHSDILKKDDLTSGDNVSTDQYKCRVNGRLPYTKGKEDPSIFSVEDHCLWIMPHQWSRYTIKFH